MNALATLRRNRERRANARARAAFFREAGQWAGLVALALVAFPCVGGLAWLIGNGINLG